MHRSGILLICLLALVRLAAVAQPTGSDRIQLELEKLRTVGRVLHIAAHPDDENTELLAYFARGRHLRTAYLSLTRGEGGQNLIGAEQGAAMGVIRTQELLAARQIDGAEQFFTRAIDFGFTKTPEETLEKWGREETIGDIVWVIRKFRPDVIVLRFSGTPRDGHGQHQASALLAKEAFAAAGDPKRYPEQLQAVGVWQAKRLFWNQFSFNAAMEKENAKVPNRIELDTGAYNPLLGASYGEIASRSRSQHSSQAMGVALRRGSSKNYLVLVGGEPAVGDPFSGIDTTWKRIPGGAEIGTVLNEAIAGFDSRQPQAILPHLLRARRQMQALVRDPEAARKLEELDEVIALCAGLWADASAEREIVAQGTAVGIQMSTIVRLPAAVEFLGAALEPGPGLSWLPQQQGQLPVNVMQRQRLEWTVPVDTPVTEPYWLILPRQGERYSVPNPLLIGLPETPPVRKVRFRYRMQGVTFDLVRPVENRYVDNARGEFTRRLVVAPPVAVSMEQPVLVFGSGKARRVQLTVRANQADAKGTVRLQAPEGWKATPASHAYTLAKAGEQTTVSFEVTPPTQASIGGLEAVAECGSGRQVCGQAMQVIRYPHIPPQTLFPAAVSRLVRADVQVTAKSVGYVMGAGDDVPDALRQIGLSVVLLSDEDLAREDLSRFDAVLLGVRAFNTRAALRANFGRLLQYTEKGGTLVVQYNVVEGFPGSRSGSDALSRIGPYPIEVGRDRVTVEGSPVQVKWENPVMRSPNKLTEADFEGWVQERGLYFAKSWDEGHYTSLMAAHDPNEEWLPGGMLYTKYGKGAYVFTAYSWFRQLPAGVPGAYRIMANLLSAGSSVGE